MRTEKAARWSRCLLGVKICFSRHTETAFRTYDASRSPLTTRRPHLTADQPAGVNASKIGRPAFRKERAIPSIHESDHATTVTYQVRMQIRSSFAERRPTSPAFAA